MKWSDICKTHPNQWLVVEALEAVTTANNQRHVEHLAVIEPCSDGTNAMQSYRRLHQEFPDREFYFVHTSRENLDIRERQWLGIRKPDETRINL